MEALKGFIFCHPVCKLFNIGLKEHNRKIMGDHSHNEPSKPSVDHDYFKRAATEFSKKPQLTYVEVVELLKRNREQKMRIAAKDMRPLKNRTLQYFAILGALFTLSLPLLAGPDPKDEKWTLTTVAWIKHHQTDFVLDEVSARLVGKVIHQYGRYIYFFFDGTGKIQLYSEIQLPTGKSIVVRGNIDENSFNVISWSPANKPGEHQK